MGATASRKKLDPGTPATPPSAANHSAAARSFGKPQSDKSTST
jgi:hypothetical protein